MSEKRERRFKDISTYPSQETLKRMGGFPMTVQPPALPPESVEDMDPVEGAWRRREKERRGEV